MPELGEGQSLASYTSSLRTFGFLGPIAQPLAAVDPAPRPVLLFEHPAAMVRDDPELWSVADEWVSGYWHEPSTTELTEVSGWLLSAVTELRAANALSLARVAEKPSGT